MLPPRIAHKLHDTASEKTTETLFVSNAFHYLRVMYPYLNISLFAPSQTDEDILGYDARFVGANFCFEVLLQFKKVEAKAHILTIKPSHIPSKDHGKTQHEILQAYPRRTAFYVAPTFRSYDALEKKHGPNSEEFLDNYIAIDVTKLDPDTTRVQYEKDPLGYPTKARHLAKHKQKNALNLRYSHEWLKGSELFKFFIAGNIGVSSSNPERFNLQDMAPEQVVGSLVRLNDESNSGVRMYSVQEIIETHPGQIIDDPRREHGRLTRVEFLQANSNKTRNNSSIRTYNTYMFRVYNPL